jgi:DHA1 family tetracycline resistance protein-like MFS transporter
VLVFSLAGNRRQLRHARDGAQRGDAVPGAHRRWTVWRQYLYGRGPTSPTLPRPRIARAPYGLIGAAFGLGFIFGPALSGILARVSYTAPIWAAGRHYRSSRRSWRGCGFLRRSTEHRPAPATPFRYLPELLRRPLVRRVLVIDFVYWTSFAIFQTTFALFTARRFGFDAPKTGYVFAAFGVLGAVIQGGFIRPIVRRLGDKSTFMLGLACGACGCWPARWSTPSRCSC